MKILKLISSSIDCAPPIKLCLLRAHGGGDGVPSLARNCGAMNENQKHDLILFYIFLSDEDEERRMMMMLICLVVGRSSLSVCNEFFARHLAEWDFAKNHFTTKFLSFCF